MTTRLQRAFLSSLTLLGLTLPATLWETAAHAQRGGHFNVGSVGAGGHFGNHGGNQNFNGRFNYGGGYGGGSYNPYGYGYGDTYGGYLSGAADVISAQSQSLLNTQQAMQMYEQYRRSRLDTRRAAIEEWKWERANLPTPEEERERNRLLELQRSLNNPPVTEIWAGIALNNILTNLEDLRNKGMEGPPIPVDPSALKNINVTNGKGPGSVGLLRETEKISWPIGLRGLAPANQTADLRSRIEALFTEARNQAANSRVDVGTINELSQNIDTLRKILLSRVNDFSFNQYTESKRFLNELDNAVKTLQQPDAKDYITGKYAAQGQNVKQLVDYMATNGLRFSPASGGDESAYSNLYQSLVRYNNETSKQLSTTKAP